MGEPRVPTGARRCATLAAVLPILVAGCTITAEQKAAAITGINQAFQAEYERILKENGTRVFQVRRDDAFVAMRATLPRVGMQVVDENPALGYLNARGPAPRPLDLPEWRRAEEADLPKAREIIRKYLGGIVAALFTFEPEGLDVLITATVLDTRAGAEVALTVRMRETAPPKGDLPRREYVPPTAVRMGLEKIWREFEQELRTAPARR